MNTHTTLHTGSCRYDIWIEEILDGNRAEWFSGVDMMCYTCEDANDAEGTLLTGVFPDQSALFGVLARIRDLNLTLVSVNRRIA